MVENKEKKAKADGRKGGKRGFFFFLSSIEAPRKTKMR